MLEKPVTIAIASGKGGVGKSVIAVNLAETLADLGYRTALMDVDLGQSACDVLTNTAPVATVVDLAHRRATIEKVVSRAGNGFSLVVTSAEAGQSDGRTTMLYEAMDEVLAFLVDSHDVILIDAPAGTENTVRWAVDRADLTALVLVEEPTAISDAYRLARLIWERVPGYPLASVVNYADSTEGAESVAERFNTITRHFTGSETRYAGWLPYAEQVRASVRDQLPVVRTSAPLQAAFAKLAQALVLDVPAPALNSTVE